MIDMLLRRLLNMFTGMLGRFVSGKVAKKQMDNAMKQAQNQAANNQNQGNPPQ